MPPRITGPRGARGVRTRTHSERWRSARALSARTTIHTLPTRGAQRATPRRNGWNGRHGLLTSYLILCTAPPKGGVFYYQTHAAANYRPARSAGCPYPDTHGAVVGAARLRAEARFSFGSYCRGRCSRPLKTARTTIPLRPGQIPGPLVTRCAFKRRHGGMDYQGLSRLCQEPLIMDTLCGRVDVSLAVSRYCS